MNRTMNTNTTRPAGHNAGAATMTAKITLTPAQLTSAQMGKEVPLNTGETLSAAPTNWGTWKYFVCWEGTTGLIRYAESGLETALWALNASEDEYKTE